MAPSQALNQIRRLRRDRYGQAARANRLNITRGTRGTRVGGTAATATATASEEKADNNTTAALFSTSSFDRENSGSTIRQRSQSQNKTSFIEEYTSNKKSSSLLHKNNRKDEKHESLTSSLLDGSYLEMKALGVIPSMKKRYAFSNKLDQVVNGEYIVPREEDNHFNYDDDGDDEEEFCCIAGKDKFSMKRREYWRRRLRDFYILFFALMFVAGFVQLFSERTRIEEEDSETIQISYEGKLDTASMKFLKDEKINANQTMTIASILGKLNSVNDMTQYYNSANETPFFLDIALTGSSVVKASLLKCHSLVLACEVGLQQPDYDENSLQTFSSARNHFNAVYVNVDTSTKSGLKRAEDLGLVSSRISDVIAVNSLYDGAYLFHAEGQKARMFAMFVHPFAYSIGSYHYLKKATWDEKYDPDVEKMSLHQFITSKHLERNPMVRLLSQIPGTTIDSSSRLTRTDLEVAKKVVETKCLVGLYRDLTGSLARFDRYFGWSRSTSHRLFSSSNSTDTALMSNNGIRKEEIKGCRAELIKKGDRWLEMQKMSDIESDSIEYKILAEAHALDMKLFSHIENIYEAQGERIFNVV